MTTPYERGWPLIVSSRLFSHFFQDRNLCYLVNGTAAAAPLISWDGPLRLPERGRYHVQKLPVMRRISSRSVAAVDYGPHCRVLAGVIHRIALALTNLHTTVPACGKLELQVLSALHYFRETQFVARPLEIHRVH